MNPITLLFGTLLLISSSRVNVQGFTTSRSTGSTLTASRRRILGLRQRPPLVILQLASEANGATDETQTLGLITFDLDDTLYPIQKVEEAANEAFVKAMARYGFTGLKRDDIVSTAKEIRDEMNIKDPKNAAALTHLEVRELAIRRAMEKATLKQKLQDCADDWATPVESLSSLVVANAKKWSKAAVSDSMVKAVSTAWEMERHHASERCLYPEVLEALKQIKQEHPEAIIGAVTDGRSNPLFMTFTLAPYFDFSCSWEDDQANRKEFFQGLDQTGGETSQLTWIYDEARYKYAVLKQAADAMKKGSKQVKDIDPLVYPATYDDRVWIHVGDDLAFDVGASAACGAKTIYCELADKYGQTARHRYYGDKPQPSWSSTPDLELRKRYEMAESAVDRVSVKLQFLGQLPEAVNSILTSKAEMLEYSP
uniref:Uncharacterized protein n=1 Tax=Amphora coffeiformis TaxID=265554 RepID=A0A7S3L1T6_9STRA